jgi:hypothetical protein
VQPPGGAELRRRSGRPSRAGLQCITMCVSLAYQPFMPNGLVMGWQAQLVPGHAAAQPRSAGEPRAHRPARDSPCRRLRPTEAPANRAPPHLPPRSGPRPMRGCRGWGWGGVPIMPGSAEAMRVRMLPCATMESAPNRAIAVAATRGHRRVLRVRCPSTEEAHISGCGMRADSDRTEPAWWFDWIALRSEVHARAPLPSGAPALAHGFPGRGLPAARHDMAPAELGVTDRSRAVDSAWSCVPASHRIGVRDGAVRVRCASGAGCCCAAHKYPESSDEWRRNCARAHVSATSGPWVSRNTCGIV